MDLAIHGQLSSPFREERRPFKYSRNLYPRAILGQEVTTPSDKWCQDPDDKEQLNLQPNVEGVLEFRRRIQGDYRVYLPDSALYTVKVVQRARVVTLHGGAGLTMAKVRERFWVPRLQKLVKSILAVGDVVIIKSVERNRNCWLLSIIEELVIGRDQVGRGAKLRNGKSVLERPVQHLYSLELVCDRTPPPDKPTLLNPGEHIFRPRWDAVAAADLRIQDTIGLDNEQWGN